jgi:hypothetical protein
MLNFIDLNAWLVNVSGNFLAIVLVDYSTFLFLNPLQNIDDIRNGRRTKVPIFDLESGARSGFKELEVSEDCGVVSH